jgi:hypothetical protein
LKHEPGLAVEVVDGNRGEFSVLVNGQVVASKEGDALPGAEEVVAAVREAIPVGTEA